MLLILGKRALDGNRETICFYYFFTVVWTLRACLASFIEPWPLEPIPSAAIAQLILADILAIAAIIVSISFLREMLKKQKC